MVKKSSEYFMKKNYKKQINKDLGQKQSLKEKEIKYKSNGKDMIIHLIAGLIKMILYKNESILKPYGPFGRDFNVKVGLSNYATKADIKNISHVDTLSFPLKLNLASLKTKFDKLDIEKLVPVHVDLN